METADYRGARIATRLSELGLRTFRALGATGEAIVPGSDASSFDGFETDITGLQDDYDGPPRTLAANVNLWPRALVIVMNRDAYERLSDDQREALRAGRAAIDPALQHIREREREALGIVCRRAEPILRSATASQLDALRTATELAHAEPRTRSRDPGRCARDRGHARRGGTGAGAGLPARGPPSNAEGQTPVDGLWRMTTSADELARIAAPGDVVPENWGESTFALVAGRFAFTTENRDACVWAYGRYAVKGSLVEWTVEDGGGISPNDFLNTPGGEVPVPVESLPRPAHAGAGEGRDLSRADARQAVAADRPGAVPRRAEQSLRAAAQGASALSRSQEGEHGAHPAMLLFRLAQVELEEDLAYM